MQKKVHKKWPLKPNMLHPLMITSVGLLDLLVVVVVLVDIPVDVGGLSLLPGCGSLLPGCGSLLPGCCRPNGFGSWKHEQPY